MIVGAALSLSGTVYQEIFKNPLVLPDLLDVSAGACVGASVAILLGMSSCGTIEEILTDQTLKDLYGVEIRTEYVEAFSRKVCACIDI